MGLSPEGLNAVLVCGMLAMAVPLAFGGDADPSDPAKLPPPPPHTVGFPSRDQNLDAFKGFVTPPTGYSEVPYWWWQGDPLTKERLTWQLDQLRSRGILGLQVNLCHAKGGGGGFGMTYPTDPPLFSAAWWELWKWVVAECSKRGMSIGLSDYTLAWPGNKQWVDEILADPDMQGKGLAHKAVPVAGGKALSLEAPENTVSAVAYPVKDGQLDGAAAVDLRPQLKGRSLSWTAPEGQWQVVLVSYRVNSRSIDPMHPLVGKTLVEKHFQRFEQATPGEGGKGLNWFFQDELMFGIGGNLWTKRFPDEFQKRKGYDIVPCLPALFTDIGPKTPKVRLDYSDVMVALEEDGYFKPIFDWHYSRGMIYGCDQCSRGKDPREYGDYFRCVRWFTAPGHDTPGVGADLIKGKVSSSIAHLYQRPRVWLEGYHSAGWGFAPSGLMQVTRENFIYGCNLLNLHGLYYTTHGGWWEWAPPCYHFRMPYWEHMGTFLRYFDRLSYLLSQGVHRCDVAILYPVAPGEAGMGANESVQAAFSIGPELFKVGMDYDYMDFESLARAKVEDKELRVAGEQYRVLILPAMAAVRWSTLQKALEFHRAGGVVLATGCLPEASDRAGRDDAELDAAVKELFGVTAKEAKEGKAPAPKTNAAGGVGLLAVERTVAAPQPKKDPNDRWVWSSEKTPKVYFKAVWPPAGLGDAKGPFDATIKCDNEAAVFVNAKEITRGADYTTGWTGKLDLKDGDVLTIDGLDHDNGDLTAGLFVTIATGGKTLMTESDFRYTLAEPNQAWRTGRDMAKLKQPDPDNVHPHHKGKSETPARAARNTPVAMVRDTINKAIPRDFIPEGSAYVLHRKIGPRDVFMVMNAPKGSECFFRAKGRVELWDPWTGKASPLYTFTSAEAGTRVRLPLEAYDANIIVFSPGEPGVSVAKTDVDVVTGVEEAAGAVTVKGFCQAGGKKTATIMQGGKAVELEGEAPVPPAPLALDGPWDFELKPTLDNQFGDFRQPPSKGLIGAEARQFRYAEETRANPDWHLPGFDNSKWQTTTCSFGPRFWQLGPVPPGVDLSDLDARLAALATVDPAAPVESGGQKLAWRPYTYSLRWGVEGDPGEQGYHGLKEIVHDEFIVLGGQKGAAGTHYLWTSVLASQVEQAHVDMSGLRPEAIWLNGKKLEGNGAALKTGANPVLLRYAGSGRGYCVFDVSGPQKKTRAYPLAMRWYNDADVRIYDPKPGEKSRVGWYRFTSPPALRAMTFAAHGKVRMWANGQELAVEAGAAQANGAVSYRVTIANPSPGAVPVAIRMEQQPGYHAGAAIPEPIALDCGVGQAPLGDWSKMGVLAAYSGGAAYRKKVSLSEQQVKGRVLLQLGNVVATAEVRVNGQSAGVRVAPPWSVDITPFVKAGENQIEVLVYNALSNHYATIPTSYRGSPVSGLIGPVRIETLVPVTLKAH